MRGNSRHGVLYCAFSLLLTAGIIACLVAAVNGFTAPIIEKQSEKALKQSIEKIFSDCSEYEDITGSVKPTDGVVAVYRVERFGGGEDNYCVHASAAGYGDKVEMLVGFDCDGLIVGVAVLSADGETPGVGQRINESSFLDGFGGLAYNDTDAKVDGISGATVSSGAALKAVNSACLTMESVLGGEESEVTE